MRCRDAGMTFQWTAEAVITETVPQSRTSLGWIAKRGLRIGDRTTPAEHVHAGVVLLELREIGGFRHGVDPDLDVDLAVESIEHPEKYPLVSKAQPIKRLQPTAARARSKKQASRRRG